MSCLRTTSTALVLAYAHLLLIMLYFIVINFNVCWAAHELESWLLTYLLANSVTALLLGTTDTQDKLPLDRDLMTNVT